MKIKFLLLFFFLISGIALNQTRVSKSNSVYFELAGNGGVGSVNFESIFLKMNRTDFTWRVGLSFAPIDRNNGIGIVVPFMANALIGKGAHKFETGIGQGVTVTTKGNVFALTLMNLGYRFQSPTKPVFYRITYTPLFSYLVDYQVQQWGGLSIGYTFKKN